MKKGYTLLEMSIVLLIVSLIASSVLWGLSVLRQAQIRSVTADFDHYQQALNTFHDRYNQLPGDMPNAESFWNNGNPCPAPDAVPKKITCNGSGDGKVSPQDYDNTPVTNGDFTESFLAWQHLYDAGFIDTAMTGNIGPATTEMQPGLNVPATTYGEGAYMLYYLQCTGKKYDTSASPCVRYFPARYGHVLEIGEPTSWAGAGGYSMLPVLTATEAWRIDAKMDDGNPATGKVLAPASEIPSAGTSGCVTNANPATAAYIATASGKDNVCTLVYITGL